MNNDLKHLKWLSTGSYVYAGITFLFSLIPVIHLTIGIAIIGGALPGTKDGPPPPAFVGWFFAIFASLFILFGMAIAVCNFLAAGFLKRQSHYIFCFVIGALNCMFTPLGTVLGIFTILVLLREPVKQLFAHLPQNELQAAMSMTAPPDWK